jgi:hypothetical protein
MAFAWCRADRSPLGVHHGCTLNRERLALVDHWLAEERRVWDARTLRLEQLVTNPEETP